MCDKYSYLDEYFGIDKKYLDYVQFCLEEVQGEYKKIDEIREINQYKVLYAFQRNMLSASDFYWTTGYGYGDIGRDKVEDIYSTKTYSLNSKVTGDFDVNDNKDSYNYNNLDDSKYFAVKEKIEEINILDQDKTLEKRKILPNGYSIVGAIFNQYIILEDYVDKSIYLLDQHAAHERINYERLKSDFKKNSIDRQNLISGYLIEFSPSEFEIIKKLETMLDNIGFELDEFGDNTIILRSVPVYLDNLNPEELFRSLIESNDIKESLYDINPYKVMKLACVASIKTGDKITNNEINKLIENLNKCEVPYTCPHGRPTIIKISKKEIDKEFFRIQI